VKHIQLDKSQILVLLGFVKQHIESEQKRGVAFSLFKSIIARKIEVIEIYDLIKHITNILVQSEDDNIIKLSQEVNSLLSYLGEISAQNIPKRYFFCQP